MAVVGGAEEGDTIRARRDSKSMSVCGTTDRTADRRSKGVINLLFKSKVRTTGFMLFPRETIRLALTNQHYNSRTDWSLVWVMG